MAVVDPATGFPFPGYTLLESIPFIQNSTREPCRWSSGNLMSDFVGMTVAFKVEIAGTAKVYALRGNFSRVSLSTGIPTTRTPKGFRARIDLAAPQQTKVSSCIPEYS